MPPATTARILRFEVPVDDRWHTVTLPGPIVHVATRRPDVVEVWATTDGCYPQEHELRVYGTGQPYPADHGNVCHVGTAIVPGGELVWHLMQRGPNRPTNTTPALTAAQLGEMSIRANVEQVEAIRHHARGYADAIAALRDDARYRDWWSSTGVKPDGPMRQHLADYLETVGPDGPDITAPPAPRAERGPNLPVNTKEHP